MRFPSAALLLALLSVSSVQAQPRAVGPPVVDASEDDGTVRLHIEEVHYEVTGGTPAALAAALERHGPQESGRAHFARTEWEVDATYRLVRRRGSCRLGALTVRAHVQTRLPRWRRSATAPVALQKAWGRFYRALARHERGHRVLAEEAAEAVRRRLVDLRGATCASLEAEAHREVVAVLNEYERYNRAYDAATGHGRTEGAVWPPRW